MPEQTPDSVEDARGPFRELREYARGDLDVDHQDIYPFAGLVEDDEVRDVLAFFAEVYEPVEDMPADFYDTKLARRLIKRLATDTAAKALEKGDINRAAYLTGIPDYSSDVSGLVTIQRLENWLIAREAAKIIYLAGHMGNGKTDFAHLLTEIVDHRLGQQGEEVDIRTNIESSEYRTINEYERLEEWMSTGSAGDHKWFIFDEASSELSGYSHDRAKVEQLMSSLVKKMRKNGVSMIIIGHTGMDLHADLRRLADYVEKQSLKTADVYASVKGGDGVGHQFRLDRIPPSSVDFDTEDEAEWDWGDAVDDDPANGITDEEFREWRDKRMARLYFEVPDLDQKSIANSFDVSQTTVSTAVRQHRNEFEGSPISEGVA